MNSGTPQPEIAVPLWEASLLEIYERRFGHVPTRRQEQAVRHAALQIAADAHLTIDNYVALLGSLPLNSQLVQALLSPTTNKESYFFRDAASTASLRQHVLPQLILRNADSRVLRIWSAGCSTGEEIYSISILLQELLCAEPPWAVTLLGTDIDLAALRVARRAEYRNWSLRSTDLSDRLRYFHYQSATGVYTLRERYRTHVHFDVFNLVDAAAPLPAPGVFDLILCRNVSIYFSAAARAQLALTLKRALARDGVWIAGASDPLPGEAFETAVYPGVLLHRPLPELPEPTVILSQSAGPISGPALPSGWIERGRILSPLSQISDTDLWVAGLASGSGSGSGLEKATEPHNADAVRTEVHSGGIPGAELGIPPDANGPSASVWQFGDGQGALGGASEQGAQTGREAQRAARLLEQAKELGDRGELARARLLLCEAVDLAPTVVEAHLVSAMLHEAAGDLEAALGDYRRALYLDPLRAEVHLRAGLLLLNLRRKDEAIRALRNAVAMGAADVTAREIAVVAGRNLAKLMGDGNG